jgi:hypothetical protein
VLIGLWNAPLSDGTTCEEQIVSFDRSRSARLLISPALFDEANKMRRFTVELMRRLDSSGIDSFLPDLPGTNESLLPLEQQTLVAWRQGMDAAFTAFNATHCLAIRGGALIAPALKPLIQYAPIEGAKLLKTMIRAEGIARREAGDFGDSDTLLALARSQGATLGGWRLGSDLVRELELSSAAPSSPDLLITQDDLPDGGLWLRAEPSFDADQADALAQKVVIHLKAKQ